MISKEAALELILENTREIEEVERISIEEALGRVLAEDQIAPFPMPPFNNSAMDGYAVISDDTKGASEENPATLHVIGEVKAGDVKKLRITRGNALRIMTGAMVPEGADAVVMQEYTREENGKVLIFKEVVRGENVREKGEEIKSGEVILKRGKEIRAYEIGLLAAFGIERVPVFRNPRVSIIVTGNELYEGDGEPPTGMIRDSNSKMLRQELLKMRVDDVHVARAKDTEDSIREKLEESLQMGKDVIMISGGVSVGKYDLVKGVLNSLGFKEVFHKVRVKPGKPLLFGTINHTLVFGLPGNPVSTMINFVVFVKPSLFKMQHKKVSFNEVEATLWEDITKKPGRIHFVRVSLKQIDGKLYAVPLRKQGSSMITTLTEADGFVEFGEEETLLKKETTVKVRLL